MQINETANNIKKMHSFEMYPRIRQMKIYLFECPGRNLLGLHHLLILALLKNGLKLKVRVFGFNCKIWREKILKESQSLTSSALTSGSLTSISRASLSSRSSASFRKKIELEILKKDWT